MRTTFALIGLVLCAACGGGSTGTGSGGGGTGGGDGGTGGGGGGTGGGGNPSVDQYVMFLDPTTTGTAALSSISLSGGDVTSRDDSLDGSDISVDGLAGQFNSARDKITFTVDGGSATVIDTGTTYVALVDALPIGTDPFRAIIGVPTLADERPTEGAIDYVGLAGARFVIIDADEGATFALSGDSSVTVDFDNDLVTMTFDNLDGTKKIGTAAAASISDLGVLLIEDAIYQDGSFSGGTAEFTARVYNNGAEDVSDITGNLSGSEIVTTAGALFGPDGGEVAGIIHIDDSGDALLISGSFTAD